jgi:hypothetical protein
MLGVATPADTAQHARGGAETEHADAEQQGTIELRGCAQTRTSVLSVVLVLVLTVLVLGLRMGD